MIDRVLVTVFVGPDGGGKGIRSSGPGSDTWTLALIRQIMRLAGPLVRFRARGHSAAARIQRIGAEQLSHPC